MAHIFRNAKENNFFSFFSFSKHWFLSHQICLLRLYPRGTIKIVCEVPYLMSNVMLYLQVCFTMGFFNFPSRGPYMSSNKLYFWLSFSGNKKVSHRFWGAIMEAINTFDYWFHIDLYFPLWEESWLIRKVISFEPSGRFSFQKYSFRKVPHRFVFPFMTRIGVFSSHLICFYAQSASHM